MEKQSVVNVGDMLIKVLSDNKMTAGGGECRRLFACGGISVNGNRVSDVGRVLVEEDFSDGAAVVRVGRNKILTLTKGA